MMYPKALLMSLWNEIQKTDHKSTNMDNRSTYARAEITLEILVDQFQ